MARWCAQCNFKPDADTVPPARACPQCGTPYPGWDGGGFVVRDRPGAGPARPAGATVTGPARTAPAAGAGLIATVREWCRGRSWAPRALLLGYAAYIAVRHLPSDLGDPEGYTSLLLGGLNLGIHELGHVVLPAAAFGGFIQFAAGTLFQLAAPVAGFIMFRRQRDWFAQAFAGVWLATNLYYIAWYMSSAHKPRSIRLVSPFGQEGVRHDWNYLLSRFDLVPYDGAIAAVVRWGGHLVMWAALAAMAWMVWEMMRRRPDPAADFTGHRRDCP